MDATIEKAMRDLESGSEREKKAATSAITKLGPKASGFIPELARLVEGGGYQANRAELVLSVIAETDASDFAELGEVVAAVRKRIEKEEYYSGELLKRLPPAAWHRLLELLETSNPQVRQAAAQSIASCAISKLADPAARPMLEKLASALAARLGDKSHEVVYAAVCSLGFFGALAGPAVPGLAKQLKSKHAQVAEAAARALAELGPVASASTEALLACANAGDAELRVAAIGALAKVAAGDAKARDAIHALAQDENEDVAGAAAEAMDAFGKPSADDEAGLLEMLRAGRGQAVAGIGAEVIPKLLAFVEHPQAVVRANAAAGLGVAKVREAVPRLARLLRDEDVEVRQRAAVALLDSDELAAGAEDALLAALEDPDKMVRKFAREALEGFGSKKVPHPLARVFGKLEIPSVLAALWDFAQDTEGDFFAGDFEMSAELGADLEAWFSGKRAGGELIAFGHDGRHSLYALWRPGGRGAPEDAPVVYLDSEGTGSEVVAEDVDAFVRLLALDLDGLGGLSSTELGKAKPARSAGARRFRTWLKKQKLAAPTSATPLVGAAREKHGTAFSRWLEERLQASR